MLEAPAQTQQDLTKRLWTIAIPLRNAHPGEGRFGDKTHILAALQATDAPLSTRSLVQQVQSAAGEPPSYDKSRKDWDRIVRCLNYLRKEGVVVMSDAPVTHYRQRFWALAERQSEFWPSGVPTQKGRHLDTQRLLALLENATEPLTCREIVVRTLEWKGLSAKEIQMLCIRMANCLEFHRKRGAIEKVPMPQWGKNVHGWVIVQDRTENDVPPEKGLTG